MAAAKDKDVVDATDNSRGISPCISWCSIRSGCTRVYQLKDKTPSCFDSGVIFFGEYRVYGWASTPLLVTTIKAAMD